jgi:hypothetical protein
MTALVLAVFALAALPAAAQSEEAKPAKTEAKPAAQAPAAPGQPVNIRIEVTINDARGGQPGLTKVVSLIAADGGTAFIRSTAEAPYGAKVDSVRHVPLHVDATPRIQGNRIRLRFSLEYNAIDLAADTRQFYPRMEIKENLVLVLENDKPLRIAETPDPLSDRRVTVELKATILR